MLRVHRTRLRVKRRTLAACQTDFRQPEIQDLRVPTFGHENVRGLDVAVDDACSVSGVERVGDVNRQTEQNIGVDGLSGDAVLQRHPVQKLHGDERLLTTLADVVNRADVGVV